ncbi:MAG: rhombosortase [Ignavibacteria bacterium RIFOXYB2_FULL_35_12]|nr:MAG: rhombosortase [Ignavibacteria bacterium GWA2_36_19]OGU54778.1 MAG: rhombosortase [Ignavibacteria bacterium GWC2_35_8]OGU62509.1 MAG: rhombosortase [Ignavibacteria bacterium GWF2_35_20]OGU81743.1 MAG: rhombosortase [Ignavibacteria bacterium RIFOXYA2_FULL_35_9]OGU87567.1 MAG: rhombosortase [Ignavibacteria bacterium RIFOXYA12_FULL_35_25]OGU87998.1 MAG: rhombosortase [Ignavibacteria bacterium RIFOXYC12_FULL_35_11]OGU96138.1 MAG: rhombosortase [Ignavibacteria bacterium RIFOXYB12_FULL_35_14
MTAEKKKLFQSLFYPIAFVILLWLVKIAEITFGINLAYLGIFPRKISGLIGIITAPFIHADFNHLISNSIPLLLLGLGISYSYPTSSRKLFLAVYVLHGLLVWIIARQAYHIGASGLVYGFVSFLFFSGIIRRDNRSIALALIVTFLYGGLTWGILPIKAETSWESHLFGSIIGIMFAFIFRKADPAPKYDWEDEEEANPRG